LGADAGVSHNTAKAWLSALEASYLIFRVPSWQPNFRRQIVKSPVMRRGSKLISSQAQELP